MFDESNINEPFHIVVLGVTPAPQSKYSFMIYATNIISIQLPTIRYNPEPSLRKKYYYGIKP